MDWDAATPGAAGATAPCLQPGARRKEPPPCLPFWVQAPGGGVPDAASVAAARDQQVSSGSVPVIAEIPPGTEPAVLAALVAAGVDGIACDLPTLLRLMAAPAAAQQAAAAEAAPAAAPAVARPPGGGGGGSNGLAGREALLADERALLASVLAFLEARCPSLEEASLLRDAVAQLDELFLIVVVGEFNSGERMHQGSHALPLPLGAMRRAWAARFGAGSSGADDHCREGGQRWAGVPGLTPPFSPAPPVSLPAPRQVCCDQRTAGGAVPGGGHPPHHQRD